MNYILRKADARDYEAVNNIFQQAHQMHVAWRPDIYQPCDRLISPEGLETPPEGTYFLWRKQTARWWVFWSL